MCCMKTSATIKALFLALMLFPEVQIKAQEEIDRVVGFDRLPATTDREQLPYLNAVAKEAFRWHNVEPLGIPHTMEEDVVFHGYLIPKGAILNANIWLASRTFFTILNLTFIPVLGLFATTLRYIRIHLRSTRLVFLLAPITSLSQIRFILRLAMGVEFALAALWP